MAHIMNALVDSFLPQSEKCRTKRFNGEISVKHATNIHHVTGKNWKGFQGRVKVNSKVVANLLGASNAIVTCEIKLFQPSSTSV